MAHDDTVCEVRYVTEMVPSAAEDHAYMNGSATGDYGVVPRVGVLKLGSPVPRGDK